MAGDEPKVANRIPNSTSVAEGSANHQLMPFIQLARTSRDLVRLTTYTPQSWEPAIAISYRLFGTTDYADEIVAMNPHIRHPLLVPPGTPLRILKH